MRGRRDDVLREIRQLPCVCDRRRDFAARQNTAVGRLGALAEFELDHLDVCEFRGVLRELFRRKLSFAGVVRSAAGEVGRANVPDDVRASQMMFGDAALAGVVIKAASFRAVVQGANRGLAQGAERHRRHVQQRRRIRKLLPDHHTRLDLGGVEDVEERVVDPLVAFRVHRLPRAEAHRVPDVLRTLIHHRPRRARERDGLVVALDEVLLDFRSNRFEEVPEMDQDRKITPQRRPRLYVERPDAPVRRRRSHERQRG
mmetsp:Transcript_26161/g.80470  ORF Transcript_26161/g.80470 Transcript_26161/m.80470 type:complete len:257 (+) Transcript_26161:935-1705(+)